MELFPLSYISQESVTSPTTEDVVNIGASVATNSDCSNCGKTENFTRVMELEQKVATLEQELATYKQILALAAGSPNCGDACVSSNTALLEQKVAALDQRCSILEQWTIPSLSHKESALNKLLKPITMLTPPALATKLPLDTRDGKEKKVVVSPANITPPVAAPRTKSLPSLAQKPPSTSSRDNGPLPNVPQNIKKTYLYIANCETTYTRNLLRAHITRFTGSNLVLSDIVELNSNNRGKAFKVSVPESKKDVVLSIWLTGIKAEPYRIHKPTRVTGQLFKGRNDNRLQRNSFQGSKSNTSNKSRNPKHQSKKTQQTRRQSLN